MKNLLSKELLKSIVAMFESGAYDNNGKNPLYFKLIRTRRHPDKRIVLQGDVYDYNVKMYDDDTVLITTLETGKSTMFEFNAM